MTNEKPNYQYNYYNLRTVHSDLRLEFESLKELIRYFESQNVRTVYRVRKSEEEVDGFGIPSKGGFFYHPSNGFRSLEDYLQATKAEFPDAATFYQAKEAGYSKFNDFSLATQNGIPLKTIFDELIMGGFKEGFEQFKEIRKTGEWQWIPESIENSAQLYSHAKENGFTSFEAMAKAFALGFKNIVDYDIAIEKGFENAADHTLGKSLGFFKGSELEFARKYKLRDLADMNKFLNLEEAGNKDLKHDAKTLLLIVSKLPQGKKVSINNLLKLYHAALEEYKYDDSKEMAPWFIRQFDDSSDSKIAFLKSDDVKKYGSYDADGEFFEASLLQNRKVVIDGSNVAHSSKGNGDNKPKVQNLILVVDALIKLGIQDITVIADASLKHKLTDKEKLPELETKCTYLEAPAEKSADTFMLQMVKREHCLVLSNDVFREWKVADSWVAEHIDFYRVTFAINGNTVLLPDFDDKLSTTGSIQTSSKTNMNKSNKK